MSIKYILAADIGGTNSRFAVFSITAKPGELSLDILPEHKVTLPTAGSESFAGLLKKLAAAKTASGLPLLDNRERPLSAASFAVPGVVREGRCDAANIAWPLTRQDVAAATGAPSQLLNDFAAQGQACLYPEILGLTPLLPGISNRCAPAVVLGAGTGLGKALILPDPELPENASCSIVIDAPSGKVQTPLRVPVPHDGGRESVHRSLRSMAARVMPSEFGHCAFPFSRDDEIAFASFMRMASKRDEIIGDMVVSGYGLSVLFAWFSGTQNLPAPENVTPMLYKHPLTLEWLARFYGRACRHCALDALALGGIYLSGGLISHVPGLRGHPAFEEEFRRSKGQAAILKQIPVWWVSNPDAGLWGAALHGLKLAM